MVVNNSEQQKSPFNPNEHLMKISKKDYLPVQWRLVWFREQCPQGTIDTEEIVVDLDREVEEEVTVWENGKSKKVMKHGRGYARYKAIVTDGKGGRATGTKSENAASFPDFIEKAETGAIGRALAGLGYGTQFTGDEFEEHHRIADSPVERTEANSGHAHNGTSNHNAATNNTPIASSASVTSSMIDKAKSDWAKAYNIADEEIEDRWIKYKVYKLGSNIADPDIKAADLGKINGDITAQSRKTNKAS